MIITHRHSRAVTLVALLALLCGQTELSAQQRHAKSSSARVSNGAATTTGSTAGQSASKSEMVKRLEAAIPTLLSDGEIPGLSIAVVEGGKLVWNKGFGVSNTANGAPVADNTVFEAASLSKPVFAFAILKLVDEGKFDLDKPLTTYLPGPYDVEGDARINQITARHVLTHSTGFPNWRPRGQAKLKINFTPGERFSYSGEGFVYLSKVIEHITAQSFDAFMKRMVFDPLSMPDSSYVWRDSYVSQKTFPHNAFCVAGNQNRPMTPNAAASLQTTAGDYGRFLAAVLNGTGLRSETARMLKTPQLKVGQRSNSIDRPLGSLSESMSWGLGWGLQDIPDGRLIWHWGDNGDSKAYVVAFEKSKTGIAVFMNGSNGLSIVPALIERSLGGVHPALKWVDYEDYRSPARELLRNVRRQGAASAIAQYRAWRKDKPVAEQISEAQMNRLGYNVLNGLKRNDDAIAVFKLNVEDFPRSANTYDSLGDAYATAGMNELAVENFKKALTIEPNNSATAAKLQQLQSTSK